MKTFITEIIQTFGGRYAGTENEKNAQLFVKAKMETFCNEVNLLPFKAALRAHFSSLKLFIGIYIIVLVLFFFNPLLSFVLATISAILFLGHFVTYRHWLDFLYPKLESWNVEGVIEPTHEVKRTLLFAGHIDSVKEFKWWYKWKLFGIVLTVVSSTLLAVYPLFIAVLAFSSSPLIHNIVHGILIGLLPTLWVLFDMHGKEVVHGANDNLTGVALSYHLGQYFAENKLQHTRIRILSFGSEEMGLYGSEAYCKQFKNRLIKENALLVNLDTIKDADYLTIATNETNTLSFFDKTLIKEMKASFDACNVAVKTLPLSVGASDASAFIMNGLPALSIIGMTTETLDKTYHTRLDNLNHLDETAMQLCKKAMIHFAEKRDKLI